MRFRRRARDIALITLYRWDLRSEGIDKLFSEVLEEKKVKNTDVIGYAQKLLNALSQNLTEIDSLISRHLENWRFDRLGYIERNALRLALAELMYLNPPEHGLVFNDFIDLVKKYADTKSAKFFNGVLSSVYRSVRATSSARRSD